MKEIEDIKFVKLSLLKKELDKKITDERIEVKELMNEKIKKLKDEISQINIVN